jgi:hypothetical protein
MNVLGLECCVLVVAGGWHGVFGFPPARWASWGCLRLRRVGFLADSSAILWFQESGYMGSGWFPGSPGDGREARISVSHYHNNCFAGFAANQSPNGAHVAGLSSRPSPGKNSRIGGWLVLVWTLTRSVLAAPPWCSFQLPSTRLVPNPFPSAHVPVYLPC